MVPAEQALAVAGLLGFKTDGDVAFGRFQGHPVSVAFANVPPVILRLRAPRASSAGLREALADKASLQSLGLAPASLSYDETLRLLTHNFLVPGRFPTAEEVKERLGLLATVALRAGPGLGERCSECEANPGEPMVFGGRIFQLCPSCFEKLTGPPSLPPQAAAGEKPAVAKGLAFGLLGALAGGILWGAIGEASGFMFGGVAIVFGYIIAFAIQKGARVVTNGLIVAAVLFTLLTVFLGFFFWVLFDALHYNVPLSYVPAGYAYVLSHGATDLGFGILVGLFGASAAVRRLRRAQAWPQAPSGRAPAP